MKLYRFRFHDIPLLHKFNAKKLLKGERKISLDLGLTTERVEVKGNDFVIRGVEVKKKIVEKIDGDKQNNIFLVFPEGVKKALFFDNTVYKLRLVSPETAPTLEINGIHMHRIKGITPWEDARDKIISAEVKKGEKVLDICTGLGYTAIHSARKGAEVATVEKDKNVLELAEFNPWSKELANERIKIFLAPAEEFVKTLESDSFDAVLHDPPREALARELYSRDFYRELYRVLKEGGRILHYVGEPKKRATDFLKATAKRLEQAGFRTEILREIKCVLGRKKLA